MYFQGVQGTPVVYCVAPSLVVRALDMRSVHVRCISRRSSQQPHHVFPPWCELAELPTPYSTHVLRQATPSSDHPNTLACDITRDPELELWAAAGCDDCSPTGDAEQQHHQHAPTRVVDPLRHVMICSSYYV